MGGKSKKTTIGYRYYMGIHMALARGPVDEVVEIRVGDKLAWAGRITDNKDIYLNQPNLFGGDDKEGGIQGTLSVMMGAPTQPRHPGLAAMLGGLVPAFRGVATAFFDGLICAMSPYPKTWAWRLRRTQQGWHQNQVWYPEKARVMLGVPSKVAVYFALDQSGSMSEVVSNGRTRLAVMQQEIISCLEDLKTNVIGAGSALDIAVVSFSSPSIGKRNTVIRNASPSDIESVKSLVSSIYADGGTYWPMGLEDMKAFFENAAADALKVGFLVTDGVPSEAPYTPEQIAAQSAAIVASLPPDVRVHGINIDLANTQYTARVDNSGEPVTVVSGGDDGALSRSIMARVGSVMAMNPAHILYQAYTDPRMGRGLPASRLDDGAWRAAANTFSNEGMGLCFKWTRADAIEKFAQTVVDHAGASVYTSRRTGKIVLLPIRGDYDINDLPLFTFGTGMLGIDDDESTSQANSANEVVVKFRDPVAKQDKSVRVKNLGAIHASGGVTNTTTAEYLGIPTASLALRVAQRDLKASSGYIKRFKVRLDRRGGDIMPGGLFRISEPGRGISSMVLRAGNCDYGTLTDGTVTITAVQDAFGLPATSFVAVEPPAFVPPDTAPPVVTSRRIFEAPYRELVQRIGQSDAQALDSTSAFLMAIAVQPSALSQSFDLMSGAPGLPLTRKDDAGAFCPSAKLKAELAAYDTTLELTAATRLAEVTIGSAAMIGDEIVRVDAIDVAALTLTIGRGCADTVPVSHALGARIYFFDEFSAADSTEYTTGVTIEAKLLTRTASGVLAESVAPSDLIEFVGRAARPYPPGNLLINGERPGAQALTGALALSWAHRNRVVQADQLLDTEAAGVSPEPATTYEVKVIDAESGAAVVDLSGLTGESCQIPPFSTAGRIEIQLASRRDGLLSWQAHKVPMIYGFKVTANARAGFIYEAYSVTVTALGAANVTWSISAGRLPQGLNLIPMSDGSALISGVIDDSEGPYTATIRAVIGTGGAEAAIDVYIPVARMVSLLHMNGANGSQLFPDETGKVWTRYGAAKISTDKARLGGASARFDGSSQFLTTPRHSDFAFDQDCTFEAWVYPATLLSGGQYGGIISQRNNSGDFSFCLLISGDGPGNLMFGFGTNSASAYAFSAMPPANQWSHVAAVRRGNVIQCFTNGVPGDPVTLGTGAMRQTSVDISIGRMSMSAGTPGDFNGYIDELRVSRGFALYDKAFTPPDTELHWPAAPLGPASAFENHLFDGEKFIAAKVVDGVTRFYSSVDGVTFEYMGGMSSANMFSKLEAGIAKGANRYASFPKYFAATGNTSGWYSATIPDFARSSPPQPWSVAPISGALPLCIAWDEGNNRFVRIMDDKTVTWSADGLVWSVLGAMVLPELPAGWTWYTGMRIELFRFGGYWYALHSAGGSRFQADSTMLMRSSDLLSWSICPGSGFYSPPVGVPAWDYFMAMGVAARGTTLVITAGGRRATPAGSPNHELVLRSTDGLTFSLVYDADTYNSQGRNDFADVKPVGVQGFVATGLGGLLVSADDGLTWSRTALSPAPLSLRSGGGAVVGTRATGPNNVTEAWRTVDGLTWTQSTVRNYNSGQHRHWRLRATSDAGDVTFGYLAFLSGGVKLTGYTKSQGAGTGLNNVDDEDAASYWSATAAQVAGGSAWVAYDFGAAKDVTAVELRAPSGDSSRMPARLEIEASDDGALWRPVWFEAALTWSAGESKTLAKTT